MSDLADAAAWLVRSGYPTDWSAKEPPPPALREAVIDAVHADPDGTLHGHTLSRDEVKAWLASECRAFAAEAQQSTEAIPPGANAEDCPRCAGTNPPYPFICPGHPAQEK